ncbi:hypothetical protein TIFTF001_012575 [Ficus carica]|uniref:Uncharacterized protein n=1 Tax=Ficus carica TaxID=3494 RepID=A0AA88D3T8_FICCA|nr:hypothetical protein TIFTF001_012575 [Ficus carica]
MKKETSVMRTRVQSLDNKIKNLKNLNININDTGDHSQKFDPAATIEVLQSRQEDLLARLDVLLSNFFGMGGGTKDEVEVLKTFLKGFEIKTSLKGFKRELNSLSFRFITVVKKLKEANLGENLELIEGNEDEVGQYRKCFKCLPKLLIGEKEDEWSNVAIKKEINADDDDDQKEISS